MSGRFSSNKMSPLAKKIANMTPTYMKHLDDNSEYDCFLYLIFIEHFICSAKSSTSSRDLVTSMHKHSSTRSALEGERVNKRTMVASEPKRIYNKGRTGQ